jgi:hypothetical protein
MAREILCSTVTPRRGRRGWRQRAEASVIVLRTEKALANVPQRRARVYRSLAFLAAIAGAKF